MRNSTTKSVKVCCAPQVYLTSCLPKPSKISCYAYHFPRQAPYAPIKSALLISKYNLESARMHDKGLRDDPSTVCRPINRDWSARMTKYAPFLVSTNSLVQYCIVTLMASTLLCFLSYIEDPDTLNPLNPIPCIATYQILKTRNSSIFMSFLQNEVAHKTIFCRA